MAKYITQRTLAGFSSIKCRARYQPHLIENLKDDPDWVVKKLKNPTNWEIEGEERMKFDAIVGNPPYQFTTGTSTSQAVPIYNYFVEASKSMNPSYISIIMPSRWFAGGMGLDNFRQSMLKDRRMMKIIDFTNAKDCFPSASIGGGVCYFLWANNYNGDCLFTNIHDNKKTMLLRNLNEHEILIRYNEAIQIVKKVDNRVSLAQIISPLSPFGINSSTRGQSSFFTGGLTLYSSDGVSYVDKNTPITGKEYIDKYKIMISKVTSEHAGEPDKNGQFKVLSTIKKLRPSEICTFSYFLCGAFKQEQESDNLLKYLKSKFLRLLLLQSVSSINLSKEKFNLIPMQDFTDKSDIDWSKSIPEIDQQLYKKYNLTQEEIDFIEKTVKPME